MKRHPSPIYVEILIRAPLEDLWEKTQNPDLHQRWDLRFRTIDYIPTATEADPQRFVYAIRILGITVDGRGETVGERDREDGSRTSALKFWSDHPLSPIRRGSGYWKYVPTEHGIRFLTWYDYSVRWGAFGDVVDRFILRPLMGWGTAWSFDRLRIWLETGAEPEVTLRRAVVRTAGLVGLPALAIAAARKGRRVTAVLAMVTAGIAVVAVRTPDAVPMARNCRRDQPQGG